MARQGLIARTKKKLGAPGRIAIAGLTAGALAYGGARAAAPLFKRASAAMFKRKWVRKRIPSLIAMARRQTRPYAALETGLLVGGSSVLSRAGEETQTAAKRHARKWKRRRSA